MSKGASNPETGKERKKSAKGSKSAAKYLAMKRGDNANPTVAFLAQKQKILPEEFYQGNEKEG